MRPTLLPVTRLIQQRTNLGNRNCTAPYFGIGTAAYNNAYLIDDQGQAHFDINSERGTVQRIEPDLSKRSTVCTGVRFTIGMDFDEHGELFASDQEGATWLPNGNPVDELLHIRTAGDETKPHYGFPPRHPKHLPNVIDEPSVFNYGPQHQSTCGIAFNLTRTFSLEEGKRFAKPHTELFGPDNWRGNVFVTGQSRGKLYRTELVSNPEGQYLARNHLIACLNMLTVDCCVSPKGDLIVACHSGGPDWGTGPTGKGKLFMIRYTDKQTPQPVAVWAAGPQEVRVAFDRPLDPVHLKNLTAQTKITYGEFVAAGDRFETLRPGYAVVQRQMASPRYNLTVHGVSVTPNRRTLVLATAPHRVAVQYALTLPGLGRAEGQGLRAKGQDKASGVDHNSVARPSALTPQSLPQHPQIDLAYSLNGVLATWEPEDKTQSGWSGVMPHLDFYNTFGPDDPSGDRFWDILRGKGTLTLETQLDLRDIAHPAVQPGSKLDHEWPDDVVILKISGSLPAPVQASGEATPAVEFARLDKTSVSQVTVRGKLDKPTSLRIKVTTGPGAGLMDCDVVVNGRDLRMGLHRFVLPFASRRLDDQSVGKKPDIPELAGGSWGRGRRVFFSEEAGCAKCHVAHGAGGAIGADLSNLIHRDYASVLRDVTLPSFAINPDYLASIVTLKDGRVLTGIVREVEGRGLKVESQQGKPDDAVPQRSTIDSQKLLIGDKEGKVHAFTRDAIDEMVHSPLSIMPEGLPKKLGEERMKDLLTFLLTEPPRMPDDAKLPAPKPRTRAEVAKVLGVDGRGLRAEGQQGRNSEQLDRPQSRLSAPQPSTLNHQPHRPLHILLVAGAKDHGPGEHDYPAWLRVWSELLRGADGVTVETAMEWPSPDQLAVADTIAFFQKGAWNAERAKAIDAHLAKGGGLVYIHWAVEGDAQAPAFAQRIGLASHAAKLKYRHGPLDVSFESLGIESGHSHPIGRHFDKVHFHDESYWLMQGDPTKIKLIATGIEDNEPRPLFWTMEPSVPNAKEQGRVFVSILGHYSWTFDDPLFRILLLRGIAWSAKEPVDRFNELATMGVTLVE